jgi:protein O-mannosyl-transferase
VELRSLKNRQIVLLCLLLAAVTWAVYWPVRLNEFVNYDDEQYITANPHLEHGLTWSGAAWAFRSGYASNWHPLTWLSHLLDIQLFGLEPAGHHLTNVLFHCANAALLFLLLAYMTGKAWRSVFVAALFALHPLHVESVAWVAERKDVLSTFFGLLAIWAYASYAKDQGRRKNAERGPGCNTDGTRMEEGRRWGLDHGPQATAVAYSLQPAVSYALALFLFALSLMSKPMLVTLPFLLLLLDYWPLNRFQLAIQSPKLKTLSPLLAEKAPFLLLSALSSIATLLVQQAAMSYYRHLAFPSRVANAVISCARYLGKTFWPQDLAVFYPHPVRWSALAVAGAVLLVTLISGLVLWGWRKRPYLVVGWFWFLGMLVPVLGLVQVGLQSMADRYTYLPLVGIFIILAWAVADGLAAARLPSWPGAVVGVAALAACIAGTRSQILVWRNTETLFTRVIALTPDNWVAHGNLAADGLRRYSRTERGALEKQLLQFDAPPPAATLGARESRERLTETIRHCEAVLQLQPGNITARVILAKALMECGQLDDACAHLELAVRLSPSNIAARQSYADVLHRQGRAKEAIAQYQATLRFKPDWDALLNNLAWLLATHPSADVRDGSQAVRLAERACRLTRHTNLWYLHTLAAAYAESGDYPHAVAAAEQARRLAASSAQSNLIAIAEHRLQLYRSGQPYRDR